MYCPKCGVQLEDGSHNCASCGWTWQEFKPKSIATDEENSTAPIEEAKSKEVKETNINEKLMTASNSNNTKGNSKKVIIIGAICLVLVASVIIGVIVHLNSDSYKIKKASELIVAGQYSEGVNKISDVYTPQAIAMKNFVKVENAKQSFVNSVENGSIADAWEAYDEFKITINEFDEENEIYYLPDNLRKNYDCYRTAFDYIVDYTETSENSINELVQALYNVQSVMMNEVDRNNSSKGGDTYTLNELQSRVNTSKSALEILNNYDFSNLEVDDSDVELYCHTDTVYSDKGERIVIRTSDYLFHMIDTLMFECECEINSSQERIDESAKEFDMDDDLYKIETIEDYSSSVGENLESISNYGNIMTNQETILKTLRKDMLYFLIVGSSANQYD